MTTEIDKRIGLNIRAQRIKQGISQTALGRQLREPVTFQQIQKYERGVNRVSASLLYEFATLFGLQVTSLFDGVPEIIGGAKCDPGLPMDGTHKLVRDYTSIKSAEMRKAVRGLVRAMAIEAANKMKGGQA